MAPKLPAVGIFEDKSGDPIVFKIGTDAVHAKTQLGFKTRKDAENALANMPNPKLVVEEPKAVAKPEPTEPTEPTEPIEPVAV
jgi:hypothetical protein